MSFRCRKTGSTQFLYLFIFAYQSLKSKMEMKIKMTINSLRKKINLRAITWFCIWIQHPPTRFTSTFVLNSHKAIVQR